MTELDVTALSKRLLCGVQVKAPGSPAAGPTNTKTAASGRVSPSQRRGYLTFKMFLGFLLFFGILALLSWSRALAGSPLGVEAAGHVYVSVPLKASQLQTNQAALRLDIMGAGVYLLRFEMAQNNGAVRLLTKSRRRNWRHQKALLRHQTVHPASRQTRPVQRTQRAKSALRKTAAARSLYLSLLHSYRRENSPAVKRALYRKLKDAYRQATLPTP